MVGGFVGENPVKAYAPTDVLKDSKLWDYLNFLQMNRVNFISTMVFDDSKAVSGKLLNQISAVSRIEMMCWDDLNPEKKTSQKVKDYWVKKPLIFQKMKENVDTIRVYVYGDVFQQLKLQLMIDDWLKELNPFLNSMKKTKRTSFIAGEGAYLGADENDDADLEP